MHEFITLRHQIPHFDVTSDTKFVESTQGTVMVKTCGRLDINRPLTCPDCGAVLHSHAYEKVFLRDLPIMGCLHGLETTYERHMCSHCGKVFRDIIPFKSDKHFITDRLEKLILQYLSYGFTNKAICKLTGVHAHIIKDIEKSKLEKKYDLDNLKKQRFCSLIEHTAILQKSFIEKGIETVVINGSMSNSDKAKSKEIIASKACSIVISTGKYLGEGTDIPYLDTLMVATPVSWEGIVSQYAGRIAREYEGKKQTLIYDYVDACIPQYAKMYIKRLNTYRKLGYNVSQESTTNDACQVSEAGLFYGKSFYSQFDILDPIINSFRCAKSRIIISSPEIFISNSTKEILEELRKAKARGIKVEVRTKTVEESLNKDAQSESLSYIGNLSLPVSSSQQAFLRFAVIDSSEVWFGDINLLGGAIKKYQIDEIEQKVMIHIFSANAVDSLVDSKIGLL